MIEMARSIFARDDHLYGQVRNSRGFSDWFYERHKACWDHRLDVLYAATTMQAQQGLYPETEH